MESLNPESISVSTEPQSTTRQELQDELATKKAQLKNYEERLNGSVKNGQKQITIVEEIEGRQHELVMMTVEFTKFGKLSPVFEYEQDETWAKEKLWFGQKRLDNLKDVITTLKQQHEQMVRDLPQLKNRVEALTNTLNAMSDKPEEAAPTTQ